MFRARRQTWKEISGNAAITTTVSMSTGYNQFMWESQLQICDGGGANLCQVNNGGCPVGSTCTMPHGATAPMCSPCPAGCYVNGVCDVNSLCSTAPQNPANGTYSSSCPALAWCGETCALTCDPGYNPSAPTATCQPGSGWTAPTCEPNPCPTLVAPANGGVQQTGTVFPASATYTCASGYTLVGSSVRTCTTSGTWDGQAPQCVGVPCDALTAPDNGALTVSNAGAYPSSASFYCDPGYLLAGASSITCATDGTWSAPEPNCEGVLCPSLYAPQYGSYSTTNGFQYPSVATFECDSGFNINGLGTSTCTTSGTWTSAPPGCTPNPCSPPITSSDVPLATLQWSGIVPNAYPSVVTWTCPAGYLMASNGQQTSTQTCLATGSWDNPTPSCVGVPCDPWPVVANASVYLLQGDGSYSNSSPSNSVLRHTCDPGFVMQGSQNSFCLSDGSWNAAPTCTPRTCNPIAAPTNGAVQLTNGGLWPSSATFQCDLGYVLTGSGSSTCQTDGTWSTPPPTCTGQPCATLTAPVGGTVVTANNNLYPSAATFSCAYPLTMSGSDTRHCGPDGSWNGTSPTCVDWPCPPVSAPLNGTVSISNNGIVPSTLAYTCDPGFYISSGTILYNSGTPYRNCNAGTWTGGALLQECTPSPCMSLADPANGVVTVDNNLYTQYGYNAYPSTASYQCDPGYSLVGGSSVRTCNPNSCYYNYQININICTYTGYAPTCQAGSCPSVTVPNGSVTVTNGGLYSSTTTATLTVTCDAGYALVGSTSLSCTSALTWDAPLPTCQPILCPALPTPSNGQWVYPQGLDPATGQVMAPNQAYLQCDSGWSLQPGLPGVSAPPNSPNYHHTCQTDGTWLFNSWYPAMSCDYQWPCNQVSGIGPNTGVTYTNFDTAINRARYPATANFTCASGFAVSGAYPATYTLSQCQPDGSWSTPPPTCTNQLPCPALTSTDPNHQIVYMVGPQPPAFNTVYYVNCNGQGFGIEHNVGGSAAINVQMACTYSGVWSPAAVPPCIPNPCTVLTDPLFGQVSTTNNNVWPSTATYTCDPGYELLGPQNRTCYGVSYSNNMGWTDFDPICKPVGCPSFSVQNASWTLSNFNDYPSLATVTCDPGFGLWMGQGASTCQTDGTWSEPFPQCRPDCGMLPYPVQGQVLVTNAGLYNSNPATTATYDCSPGYVLAFGDEVRRCSSDGIWLGTAPVCVRDFEISGTVEFLDMPGETVTIDLATSLQGVAGPDTSITLAGPVTGPMPFSFGSFLDGTVWSLRIGSDEPINNWLVFPLILFVRTSFHTLALQIARAGAASCRDRQRLPPRFWRPMRRE